MLRATLLRQRLLILFLGGLLLWFSPLVLQFETMGRWLGVPVLLIYLFTTWAAIIVLAAWVLTRGRD